MKEILRQLLGEKDERKPADESLFLSGRNYLNPQMPAPEPEKTALPPVPVQVGPVAGLATVIDGSTIIKLAPGEVYEGGVRIIPGPVDPTIYPLEGKTAGLVGAFAPVILTPSYTGPIMRVRRASDSQEQDIGSTLVNNYEVLDTAALATFCTGTDGFVVTWYNQDGSGNDLTRSAAGEQPKIYDASTGVELDNLKPAVSYDTSAKVLEAPLAIAHVPLSVFIVQSGPATQADITFNLGTTASGNEYTRLQSNAGATKVQQVVVRSVADGIAAANISDNFDQGLITIISKATNDHNIGVNGGTFANLSTNITTVNSTFLRLGENSTEEIKQQAVIIYTADKSADRAAIETALNDYFNIY